jgi:hypothetical protein
MDQHNAEEEMEIAEHVSLLKSAYQIFTINNHCKENSEKNTICHRKKVPVTEKNFLSQKETSCHRKKLPVT